MSLDARDPGRGESRMTRRRMPRGFTLVELVVVIIILAVLASIAAVAHNQYVSQARETLASTTLRQLWKGVQADAANKDQPTLTVATFQQTAATMSGGGLALGPSSAQAGPMAAASSVTVLDSSDAHAVDPNDGTRVVWVYLDTDGSLSGTAGATGLGTTAGGKKCAFLYATDLNVIKVGIGEADPTLGCRGQVAISQSTGADIPTPVPDPTTDPTPTDPAADPSADPATDPTPTAPPATTPSTPTGPQPITVAVTDTFNGTGVLGATETGGRTWIENTAGTIVRSSGNATTNAAPGTNPMALIEADTADVDVTLAASKGGEAIYTRASDAANWVRARLRAYDVAVPYSYYVTEYQHPSYATEYLWTSYTTQYQYSKQTQTGSTTTYGNWSGWTQYTTTNNCFVASNTGAIPLPPDTDTDQYAVGSSLGSAGCVESGTWWGKLHRSRTKTITPTYTTDYTWATSSPGSGWSATGNTQQVASGSYWSRSYCSGCSTRSVIDSYYWDSNYASGAPTRQTGPYYSSYNEKRFEVIVEKSVAGAVTALKTVDLGTSAPTAIRLTAKGDQLKLYTGTTLQATLTETFNSTVTRHGFGLGGPTGYVTSGIGDIAIAPVS